MTQQESQIAQLVNDLSKMAAEGKPMDAFETFYHEDLERIELDGTVVKGKDKCRPIAQDNLTKITAFRDFSVVGVVVKGNRSFVVWNADYDHVEYGAVKVVEVAIQDWQDGKIIRERFCA